MVRIIGSILGMTLSNIFILDKIKYISNECNLHIYTQPTFYFRKLEWLSVIALLCLGA